MSAELYPQVPNLPGVPSLLRLASASLPLPVLATADTLGLQSFLNVPQWGIFDQSGNVVLSPDSVLALGMGKDRSISDYPVEGQAAWNGVPLAAGFFSYNKVVRPFQARVRLAKSGNDAQRTAFLTALDAIIDDLNLYNVVTPEYTYLNANLTHYDFHRSQRHGVTLLQVDVWLEEVRIVAAATYSSSKSVNGTKASNTGYVQPGSIATEQLAPIQNAGVR